MRVKPECRLPLSYIVQVCHDMLMTSHSTSSDRLSQPGYGPQLFSLWTVVHAVHGGAA